MEDAKSKGAKLLQEYKREKNLIWPILIDHVTQVRSLPWFSFLLLRPAHKDSTLSKHGARHTAHQELCTCVRPES